MEGGGRTRELLLTLFNKILILRGKDEATERGTQERKKEKYERNIRKRKWEETLCKKLKMET